jgi:hypothetical protein
MQFLTWHKEVLLQFEERTMSDKETGWSDANDLFHQIQGVLAGHSEATVMQALLYSLLVVIGVSAPSVARAEALIDALPAELKPKLRREWLSYREHRAKSLSNIMPSDSPLMRQAEAAARTADSTDRDDILDQSHRYTD